MNLEVARVPVGERIQLNCSASGSPTPSVAWRTNNLRDSVLSDGSRHVIRTYHKSYSVFSTLEVFFDDTGGVPDRLEYHCVANNSLGTASDSVRVHVIERVEKTIEVSSTYSEQQSEVELFQYNGIKLFNLKYFFLKNIISR